MTLILETEVSPQLQNLGELGRRAISLALKYTATEAWRNIRSSPPTPVDHGRLAGSFALEQTMDDMTWRIWSAVEYARAVNEGTGIHGPTGQPYEILPVEAKALFWPGARHPVARVMHPGQPGQHYAEQALEMTEPRIEEFARRAVREVMASV